MTPIKQTVYLPKSTFPLSMKGKVDDLFCLQQGYFFTPEQLNQLLSDVIKDTLYQATQFVELQYGCGKKSKEGCVAVFCNNCHEQVDKESITNTFEETFNKFKV